MPRPISSKNLAAIERIDQDVFSAVLSEVGPLYEGVLGSMVDIVTFAEGEHFCNKKLYPRQRTLLRLFYGDRENMTDYDLEVVDEWRNGFYYGDDRIGVTPDVWERIAWLKENDFPHFREIEFIGGRRGGKGHLGGIMGAYQAYKMLQTKGPQAYYGIDFSKDIYTFIVATNLQQAQEYQFKDIADTITAAPYFQDKISTNKNRWMSLRTDADRRRIAAYEKAHIPVEREVASIKIMAQSSNSRSGRGAATFALFFDEMAHMLTGTEGPQTAEEIYKALTPSLDQLGKDGLIYVPTSPYTKVGAAYQIYQDGLAIDEDGKPENPDLLVVQLPSWSPYEDWDDPKIVPMGTFRTAPQVLDAQARRLEERDPLSFKVERRAQWAEVINAYLSPKMVDRMFAPIDTTDGGIRVLENRTTGVMRWVYRGHADPSESQANFAMAIGHTEPFTSVDEDTGEQVTLTHVVFDWLHVWKPIDFPDHQIDYMLVEQELVDTILKFTSLKSFSYDQYGGFVTVPLLKSHLKQRRHHARVHQADFTQKSNQIRAERFKSALGMGWVHTPKDDLAPDGESLLEQELKFLQTKNGKVVRQTIGPVTTKDLADCVMEVTSELLADQIDRAERNRNLSMTRLAVGAQGGYHTGLESPPQPGGNKDKLRRFGQQRSGRIYGQRVQGEDRPWRR